MEITDRNLRSLGTKYRRSTKYRHLTVDPPTALCGMSNEKWMTTYDGELGPASEADCPRCLRDLACLRSPDQHPQATALYVTARDTTRPYPTLTHFTEGGLLTFCGRDVPLYLHLYTEDAGILPTCKHCLTSPYLELRNDDSDEAQEELRRLVKHRKVVARAYYQNLGQPTPKRFQ